MLYFQTSLKLLRSHLYIRRNANLIFGTIDLFLGCQFSVKYLKRRFTQEFIRTLLKNNLVFEKQYGFRSNYSTNHALISITERIKDFVDSGNYVCGIFIDLEKAFDTVNHEILCEKLNFYGLRGNINNLIRSYLYSRKQFVATNGFNSDLKHLASGVPQGSSLGPLLFLININDFRLCLERTESGHFADDMFILFSSAILGSIESVVNFELKLASKWLKLNKLSLNADKTKLIFFRSKQQPLNYNQISIKFNGVKLMHVDDVKYLGMYLDKYIISLNSAFMTSHA